jgi:hypothetical protein
MRRHCLVDASALWRPKYLPQDVLYREALMMMIHFPGQLPQVTMAATAALNPELTMTSTHA